MKKVSFTSLFLWILQNLSEKLFYSISFSKEVLFTSILLNSSTKFTWKHLLGISAAYFLLLEKWLAKQFSKTKICNYNDNLNFTKVNKDSSQVNEVILMSLLLTSKRFYILPCRLFTSKLFLSTQTFHIFQWTKLHTNKGSFFTLHFQYL